MADHNVVLAAAGGRWFDVRGERSADHAAGDDGG